LAGLLLQGGCVLSLDTKVGNATETDLLVQDGVVAEIGRGVRARDAEVVDARGCIVLPGLVDAHRHLARSLARNAGTETPLVPDGVATPRRADDVYAATLVGLLAAAQRGTTCVVDWLDATDPAAVEAAAQAHDEAGLRTVLVVGAEAQVPFADRLQLARQAIATLRGHPRRRLAIGVPDLAAASLDDVDQAARLARELGVRWHAHAGTSRDARGTVAQLGDRALLGEEVTLVHCTTCSEQDLDAIATAGASVVLTPSTEMVRGVGLAPMQQLIDRGIRPGLGVDDDIATPGDVFAQMRAAQSVQHATLFDRKLAGKGALPQLLSTRDVIRYATVDGARAAGVGDLAGTLSPGTPADLLVLRADTPNIAPVNDPIGAVVWGMDPSNVDHVLVAGVPVVRDGALQADAAGVQDLVTAAHARVAGPSELVDADDGGAR
jgi:5-methylthioadenosine/S-adenosylhomocysteine deaminase